MENKRIAAWLVIIFGALGLFLPGCSGQGTVPVTFIQENKPAETITPTRQMISATPDITVTPTPSFTPPPPTATPVLMPAPDGIVYMTYDEEKNKLYWQVQGQNRVKIETWGDFQTCLGDGWLSSDGFFCLQNYSYYMSSSDAYSFPSVTDLTNGTAYSLDRSADYAICRARWWPAHPDYLLVGVQPGPECVEGMSLSTMPALVKYDGSGLTLIGTHPDEESCCALTENGMSIAFSESGVPYLYTWMDETRKFEPQEYGFPDMEDVKFEEPVWSPDEKKLAWAVYATMNGKFVSGVGIFDLEEKTSVFLYPYEMATPDISGGILGWSPDGKYIAVGSRMADAMTILAVDGSQKFSFPREETGWITWHPASTYAVLTRQKEDDGQKREFWLLDVQTGQMDRLNLPDDAYVIDWED